MIEYSEASSSFDEVNVYNNCLLEISKELLFLRYMRYLECGIMVPEFDVVDHKIKMPLNDVMHLFGSYLDHSTKILPFTKLEMEVGGFSIEEDLYRPLRVVSITDFVSFRLTPAGSEIVLSRFSDRNGSRESQSMTSMQFGTVAHVFGPHLSIENRTFSTPFIGDNLYLAT